MPRFTAADMTQAEIAAVWSACGWTIVDLHNAATSFRFEWRGAIHAGGLPDLLCTLGPCHVWVEVKTKEGRLEPVQEVFRDMVIEGGEWWTCERDADEALMEAQYYRDLALLVMRLFRREQR